MSCYTHKMAIVGLYRDHRFRDVTSPHRCKKNSFMFYFILVTFLKMFFFFQTFFLFLKNVGKVHSGKHINKKHFQNNSNEIDL